MTRVIYREYPVWKLPEDLREGFYIDEYVTTTIERIDDVFQDGSPDGDNVILEAPPHPCPLKY